MMSNKTRALEDLMKAVDAGHVIDDNLLATHHWSYGRIRRSGGQGAAAKTQPTALLEDASFEFSIAVTNSSSSPASMVFSDGQLRAHQYPATRSTSSAGSQVSSSAGSQVASPVLMSSSMGSTKQAGGALGSRKRVSFATDSCGKTATKNAAGGGQSGKKRKSGGLLGCIGSACGGSSRNEVVDPAKNAPTRNVVVV